MDLEIFDVTLTYGLLVFFFFFESIYVKSTKKKHGTPRIFFPYVFEG